MTNRTRHVLCSCLAVVTLAFSAGPTSAADRDPLDPAFGAEGLALADSPRDAAASGLARDSQGRLVAVGTTAFDEFAVARFLPNGDPDPGFGKDGIALTETGRSAAARAVAIQADGAIVVAGGTETAIALNRYRDDGSLDESIGKAGRALTTVGVKGADALALAIRADGRIFVAGYGIDATGRWAGILVAYRPNATVDRSFGRRGFVRFTAPGGRPVALSGVKLLPNGEILVGGDLGGRLLLARLHPDGRLDHSFGGGDGRVLVDVDGLDGCTCVETAALALGLGGRPVLVANTIGPNGGAALLARFLPSGRLDRGFGADGAARVRRGSSLALLDVGVGRGGALLATGALSPHGGGDPRLATVRLLPSGKPDPGFGSRGFFVRRVGTASGGSAVAMTPDGGAVIAGHANVMPPRPAAHSALDSSRFLLARFLP